MPIVAVSKFHSCRAVRIACRLAFHESRRFKPDCFLPRFHTRRDSRTFNAVVPRKSRLRFVDEQAVKSQREEKRVAIEGVSLFGLVALKPLKNPTEQKRAVCFRLLVNVGFVECRLFVKLFVVEVLAQCCKRKIAVAWSVGLVVVVERLVQTLRPKLRLFLRGKAFEPLVILPFVFGSWQPPLTHMRAQGRTTRHLPSYLGTSGYLPILWIGGRYPSVPIGRIAKTTIFRNLPSARERTRTRIGNVPPQSLPKG